MPGGEEFERKQNDECSTEDKKWVLIVVDERQWEFSMFHFPVMLRMSKFALSRMTQSDWLVYFFYTFFPK